MKQDSIQDIFSDNDNDQVNYQSSDQDVYPLSFKQPIKDVIQYSFIEEEVRCGQYYLRVWTQQKLDSQDFFLIPSNEEEDFLKNLQNSLADAKLKDIPSQKKFIILLKACFYSLKTFQKQEQEYLIDIKNVLEDLMMMPANKLLYDNELKKILHYSSKIFCTFVSNYFSCIQIKLYPKEEDVKPESFAASFLSKSQKDPLKNNQGA